MGILKNGRNLLDHGTLKLGVSQKDLMNRADKLDDFGMLSVIPCISDTSWMFTGSVLVKDTIMLPVPKGKALERFSFRKF